MPIIREHALVQTLLGKESNHTPVWLMRQAGRYLPEYRELRAQAGSFMALCTNPDLAAQVTLQPLARFNLDAAILFSDILVIPDAMGLELHFAANEGPKFHKPISNVDDINALSIDGLLDNLDYVFATIKKVQYELAGNKPLIGFSGSPFTLACYMIEGGASRDYQKVKQFIYTNPIAMHKLLDILADAVIVYLNAQIEAGVNVVMIFDSWGGVLTDRAYAEFSLAYLEKIVKSISKTSPIGSIPNIVFTKGGGIWLPEMAKIGANAVGLDWMVNLGHARQVMPNNIALQGNLDPVLLSVADHTTLKQEVSAILDSYKLANSGSLTGLVFNLGHGILPSAKPDNVEYVVNLVHELSQH